MDAKEAKYQRLCKICRPIRKAAEETDNDWLEEVKDFRSLLLGEQKASKTFLQGSNP